MDGLCVPLWDMYVNQVTKMKSLHSDYNPFSAGIEFRRQNLASIGVKILRLWTSDFDVYRRQILTPNVDHRTKRIKRFPRVVDP